MVVHLPRLNWVVVVVVVVVEEEEEEVVVEGEIELQVECVVVVDYEKRKKMMRDLGL